MPLYCLPVRSAFCLPCCSRSASSRPIKKNTSVYAGTLPMFPRDASISASASLCSLLRLDNLSLRHYEETLIPCVYSSLLLVRPQAFQVILCLYIFPLKMYASAVIHTPLKMPFQGPALRCCFSLMLHVIARSVLLSSLRLYADYVPRPLRFQSFLE